MRDHLQVSIASDIVTDCMSVELHLNYQPIMVGIIKDGKKVRFRGFSDTQSFEFEEVRAMLLEFIEKMDATQNITVD